MPVTSSRLPGFFKKSVSERRTTVCDLAGLNDEERGAVAAAGELSDEAADRIIENVIGTYSLPLGVATNFIIDGKHYVVPMALEEPSVVAAASNMAKRCHVRGGFASNSTEPVMIGQIQVCRLKIDAQTARSAILANKAKLIDMANSVDPILVKFGGGCRDVEARVLETDAGTMLIVHLLVDCRDAMGANAVNTMCETIGPEVGELCQGVVVLKIISNLAVHRLARVTGVFTAKELSTSGDEDEGRSIINGILDAYAFAKADPFRAATNNKGVMNAISPIAVATGQDWRAVEAGCHSYASYKHGRVAPFVEWSRNSDGDLVGYIEMPAPVGLIGGAARVHPCARACVKLLGVSTATELGTVLAAAGIAQNLGALRALATVGIQQGHMKLHAKNLAVQAGALSKEVDAVVKRAQASGRVTAASIKAALDAERSGLPVPPQ
jgi:hydroxymethylglutaryl-CoA reductase